MSRLVLMLDELEPGGRGRIEKLAELPLAPELVPLARAFAEYLTLIASRSAQASADAEAALRSLRATRAATAAEVEAAIAAGDLVGPDGDLAMPWECKPCTCDPAHAGATVDCSQALDPTRRCWTCGGVRFAQ